MNKTRKSEMGGARLKFIVVMAILISGAYAGYLYVPVAFQAYQYKDLMQHYVDVAGAQGKPPSWAAIQLQKSGPEYAVPDNVVITPTAKEMRIELRAQYSIPIEFPGYTYNYEFDHTVKSTAFIVVK
jgi:hypothetical protein